MPHPERRWTRFFAIAGISVLTLVVALLALLQLPPVATWVVRRVMAVVPLNPGYRLEVGRVSGDWIHRLALDDVRLLKQDRELARVDRLRVGYDLRRVRGAVTRLDQLSIDGGQAVARREGGSWDLAGALKRSADTTRPSGGGLAVDRIDLRGVQLAVQLSPDSVMRARGLDLRARDFVLGERMLVTIDQLNAGVSPPGTARWFALATRGAVTADAYRFDPVRIQTEETRISGRAVVPRELRNPRTAERLDVEFRATPLALADLAAIIPGTASDGDLHLTASARGDTNGLVTARLGARLDQSTLSLSGVAPMARGGVDYRVSGSIGRFDPARFYRTAPAGDLNGTVEAELRGPALDRSNGRVDLRLGASRLGGTSVRRLQLGADLYRGSAAVTLRGAVAGGTLAANGRVRPFDSIPGYHLRGAVSGLPSSGAIARTLSGDSTASGLNLGFELAGAGVSPATANARGNVTLAALHVVSPEDRPRVPLAHATFTLSNGRLDLDPMLLAGGGTITGRAVMRLGDTLTYQVLRGRVDRVDLARLTADTALGPLSGRFALRGRGTAPAQAVASLRFDLDALRYGFRQLTGFTGQARLVRGRARLEIQGPLQGGRLALLADAHPFGETKTFQLRQASLDSVDLGSFLGRRDLAGPVTLRASATGRMRGESRSVQGGVTIAPSQLGRVELRSGTITLALTGDRLTYDGSLSTNGGRLRLAGDGRPLAPVRSFAIRRGQADSLDLGTLLGRPGLSTEMNARFTGELSQDPTAGNQANLSVQLLRSRVNRALLDSGHVALNANGSEIDGDLRVQGRDIELGAELDGRTGPAMRLHTTGTLRVERLSSWTGMPNADGRMESSFQLNALGDSAGLVSLYGNINAIGGMGPLRINSAQIAMRPDSGGIRVDTIFVRSNVGALSGRGRIALRKSAASDTLRITGLTYNVAPLAQLLGDSISLDSARTALTVTGPAWQWKVASQVQVNRMLVGENLAEQMTLKATAAFDSTRLTGAQGELRVSAAAYGKTRIPAARLTGRYDSLLTLDANVAVGDSARVIATVRGTVQPDTVRATLQRLELVQPDSTWSLEQPAELELRPRIGIDGFALRSGRHRILVDGVYDPVHSSDMSVHLTDVNLEALRSLGLAPIGGRLDGWVRLQGPGSAPTMEGRLGLGLRPKNGREVGRIVTQFTRTPDEFRINAMAVPLRGGRLTVTGTLPMRNAGDTVSLEVRADSFDLGVLGPLIPEDVARDLHGQLIAKARVGGTAAAPRADGDLRIAGAGVTLPALELTYRGGELTGRLAGDELRIERLRLHTSDKDLLTAEGTVRLKPLGDPSLDLAARLRQFRISNSDALEAVASGNVRLQGTVSKPSLTGKLTMGRTDLVVGGAEAAATVEKVELTPEDLRQVARRFGPAVLASTKKSPGLVDRFHLDLDLDLPRQVWFRRRTAPKAEIELSGRIRLRQEPGQPMQFFGRVSPMSGRSTLDVYGREFRLTGGDIRLSGPTDSTLLDVTAEYQVPTQGGPEDQGVIIRVAAKGHPDSLALDFSADPEMSQEDMFSYIVTGRPASDNPLAQTSTQKSTTEMGAEVAMSALTQSLSTTAEKELGLDVFQIRQEGLHGLTLTAGRYIGSRMFLSMHLPIELGGDVQQTTGTYFGPSFELEYEAQRWLWANVEGGNVPPRFTLRSRYAY